MHWKKIACSVINAYSQSYHDAGPCRSLAVRRTIVNESVLPLGSTTGRIQRQHRELVTGGSWLFRKDVCCAIVCKDWGITFRTTYKVSTWDIRMLHNTL